MQRHTYTHIYACMLALPCVTACQSRRQKCFDFCLISFKFKPKYTKGTKKKTKKQTNDGFEKV